MARPSVLLAISVVLAAGCVGPFEYPCAGSADCGDGRCEPAGFCSFDDPECASGHRYDAYASDQLADRCVPLDGISDLPQPAQPARAAATYDPPEQTASMWLYWSEPTTARLRRAPDADGEAEDLVASGLDSPSGIALDPTSGTLYFADRAAGVIYRVATDGTGLTPVIQDPGSQPIAVALDHEGGKLYFTDAASASIRCADLDGDELETVIGSGLGAPAGLAVNHGANRIYFADTAAGKIQRAKLDGTQVRDVVTDLDQPVDVLFAPGIDRIYFTELGPGAIESVAVSGTGLTTLVSGVAAPGAVAIDLYGRHLYFADGDQILAAELDGTDPEPILAAGGSVAGLVVAP